jgi:hypothetical protein
MINYLLDENVNPRLRDALQRRLPDMVAWRVGDPGASALQASDPDILIWCEANNFILITNNRTSMPIHLRDHLMTGRHIPGIFILSPDMAIGETADELALIWEASEPDEYFDRLSYLPVSL